MEAECHRAKEELKGGSAVTTLPEEGTVATISRVSIGHDIVHRQDCIFSRTSNTANGTDRNEG